MKKLKRLLIVGAAVIMMAVSFHGCGGSSDTAQVETPSRFRKVYRQSDPIVCIYVDEETNVMYVFTKNGYGGGLTVMVDENGKPMIWEE